MALPDGYDEEEVEPDIEQLERHLDQMRDELDDMLGTLAGRIHDAADRRAQASRHAWGLLALGALVLAGTGAALWRRRHRVSAW